MVSFGKAATVKLFLGADDDAFKFTKVRPLLVDGALKEFTVGEIHDITERQFAVRRAYRVNDALPEDGRRARKWRWQRGGWLLVDRPAAHLTSLRLPDFDDFLSEVAWFRDYAAYCGVADGGNKWYAVVVQLGGRKPMLHTLLRPGTGSPPGPPCASPRWHRAPARVTFAEADGHPFTFTIPSRAAGKASDTALPAKDESKDGDDEKSELE